MRFCNRRAGIVLGALAIIAATWAVVLERVDFERDDAVAEVVHKNGALSLAYEQQVLRTLQVVDQAIRFVRHDYLVEGKGFAVREALQEGWLDPNLFLYAAIIDVHGRVVASSSGSDTADVSDRDYFRFHRDNSRDELWIGTPTVGRLSGKLSIHLTRPIHGPDGRFVGVAMVAVAPDFLAEGHRYFDIGEQGLMAFVGLDGVARVRRAGQQTAFGVDMRGSTLHRAAQREPSGNFVSIGRTEGIPRFVSYRRLQDYPFVGSVGVSVEEALRDVNSRASQYYAAAAIGSILLVCVAAGLLLATLRGEHAQAEKARAEARYRAAFDQAAVGVAHADLGGRFLRVNAKLCQLLGYSEQELLALRWQDVTDAQGAALSVEHIARMVGSPAAQAPEIEKSYRRKDGARLWGRAGVALVRDESGRPDYVVTVVRDISERKHAEEALRKSEEWARATFDQGAIGIVHAACDGTVLRVNDRFAAMLGMAPAEMLGRKPADFTDPRDLAETYGAFERLCQPGNAAPALQYEKRYRRKDGSTLWASLALSLVRDAQGRPDYVIAMIADISARKQAEEMVQFQARYDSLTSLPNRRHFFRNLTQALGQAGAREGSLAVLCVNLDRFHAINDSLGSAAGDAVLQETAHRLVGCTRPGDTVARLGGDEFALVLAQLGGPGQAADVARRIASAMAPAFSAAEHDFFVAASVGIAVYPGDGTEGEVLLANAAAAKAKAKAAGGNTFQFYAASMNERAREKLLLENDLRGAIERREFVLHFQPKASLASGALTGFEALLRWRHPKRGMVSPAQFVPLLEETGLIIPVGAWIIDAVCGQLRVWQLAGFAVAPVAVNITSLQFRQPGFCELIAAAIARHAIPAGLLEIEITESALMEHAEHTSDLLGGLRAQRVRVAIDDFGTGYSSLAYLKRLPVDALKLDRSFVAGLPFDSEDASITRAVIGLAHNLGLKVVAEGVETEEQRAFLLHHGCDEMQGYLLGRPVPPVDCRLALAAEAAAA